MIRYQIMRMDSTTNRLVVDTQHPTVYTSQRPALAAVQVLRKLHPRVIRIVREVSDR